jgi:hypothetical protein
MWRSPASGTARTAASRCFTHRRGLVGASDHHHHRGAGERRHSRFHRLHLRHAKRARRTLRFSPVSARVLDERRGMRFGRSSAKRRRLRITALAEIFRQPTGKASRVRAVQHHHRCGRRARRSHRAFAVVRACLLVGVGASRGVCGGFFSALPGGRSLAARFSTAPRGENQHEHHHDGNHRTYDQGGGAGWRAPVASGVDLRVPAPGARLGAQALCLPGCRGGAGRGPLRASPWASGSGRARGRGAARGRRRGRVICRLGRGGGGGDDWGRGSARGLGR